jgi:hypothetical protein
MKFNEPSNGRRIFRRAVSRNGKKRVLDFRKEIEMKIDPKSAQELATFDVAKSGVYRFGVIEAYDKISKTSGNEMVELKLEIVDRNGHRKIITDYLVAARAATVRAAAETCGILPAYESGSLSAADFVGCSGRVRIGIERDRSGRHGPKNVVVAYVVANGNGHIPE